MRFTWDAVKAAANAKNHGVAFAEAMTVFDDPLYISYADETHSVTEHRFLTVGTSGAGRFLVVWHTEIQDEIHLIGAREATKRERKAYEEGET